MAGKKASLVRLQPKPGLKQRTKGSINEQREAAGHRVAGKRMKFRAETEDRKIKGEKRDPVTARFVPGGAGGPGRKPLWESLSYQIRLIGEEEIDEARQMTRIQAVIRSLYADAISGKVAAAELILERGWGKVPTPVQVDMPSELRALIAATGLTPADLQGDPVLWDILQGNEVIDGQFSLAAPAQS